MIAEPARKGKRGPLFKYFGSKYRSSKYYPAPRYPLIIEPFAGGAGYSLRYREHNVLLCDIDREVIDLWAWLIAADPKEIAAMPVTGLVTGQDIRTLGLSDGAAQLMRRWQRTGHCSSWTISNITTGESAWCAEHGVGQAGGNTGMWHRNTRDYLVVAVEEIRHWSAVCESYENLPLVEATWFIDPPYDNTGKDGLRGGYKHGKVDYSRLAEWCRSLPGQVIVCEQLGADWLPFRSSHEVSGIRGKMRGQAGTRSQEVVWCSDDQEAEHMPLTVAELFAFLAGERYFLLDEPPREIPEPGALCVWAALSPLPGDTAARLFAGEQTEATYIAVAPDVFGALKDLESVGGVC